jgi:hypothetical protein
MPRSFWLYWAATLLVLPVYVGETGRPQPADFAFLPVLLVTFALGGFGLPRVLNGVAQSLAAFVAYVVTVDSLWGVFRSRLDFLVNASFYVFNSLLFLAVLRLRWRYRDQFLRLTAWGLATALAWQTVLAIVAGSQLSNGPRLQLLFLNANSLAYFVLCALTTILVLSRRIKMPAWVLVALIAMSLYLEYRTYSRAGLLGVMVLVAIALSRRPGIAFVLGIPLLVYLLNSETGLFQDQLWSSRIETVQSGGADTYLDDRGLRRILENPQYLIAGAGEGDNLRFDARGLELHSSLATIVFCYGSFGLYLFIAFLRRSTSVMDVTTAISLSPLLLFSLFHNGLRFRPFWIALAIATSIRASIAQPTATPRRRGRGSGADPAGLVGGDGAAAHPRHHPTRASGEDALALATPSPGRRGDPPSA